MEICLLVYVNLIYIENCLIFFNLKFVFKDLYRVEFIREEGILKNFREKLKWNNVFVDVKYYEGCE